MRLRSLSFPMKHVVPILALVALGLLGAGAFLVLASTRLDTLSRITEYPNAVGAAVLIAALAALLATVLALSARSS